MFFFSVFCPSHFFVCFFSPMSSILFSSFLRSNFFIRYSVDSSDGSSDILLQNMTLSIKTYRNSNEAWTCWLCFISFINPYQWHGSILCIEMRAKKKRRGTLIFMHKMHATKISITANSAACSPIRNKFIVKVATTCEQATTLHNHRTKSVNLQNYELAWKCVLGHWLLRLLLNHSLVFCVSCVRFFSLFRLRACFSNTGLLLAHVFFARFIVNSERFWEVFDTSAYIF